MLGDMIRTASLSTLLLCGGGAANAADLDYGPDASYGRYEDENYQRQPVHRTRSVDQAYAKLQSHGFHDIVVERTDVPYSFAACKRGKRYHIHIDERGELEELNSVGACGQYADDYNGAPRNYSSRYSDEEWRKRTYWRARNNY